MALGRSSCSQLPGRCTSAPAASERAGGLYVMLSLRHFRLARSWSLSLGAGAPRRARANQQQSMTRGGDHFVFAQIGAARPARVADFRFSNFRCGPHRWRSGGRAVRSYRVAAHRRRPRANGPGGSTSCSRFDISGWRDRGLYPLVQGRRDARGRINSEHDPRRRPFRFRTNRRCSTGASRRFSVLAISAVGRIDGARAVELFAATGSLHIGAGRERTGRGALRHALASTFPAGAIVVFIPWCRGAETRAGESTASMTRGGDHFVFAQIGAARPARVADFRFSNFRCGPHRWRSGGRAVRSYRVAAHRRRPRANGPGGSTSCSRFDISGWRDRGLYPLVLGRRDARGRIKGNKGRLPSSRLVQALSTKSQLPKDDFASAMERAVALSLVGGGANFGVNLFSIHDIVTIRGRKPRGAFTPPALEKYPRRGLPVAKETVQEGVHTEPRRLSGLKRSMMAKEIP